MALFKVQTEENRLIITCPKELNAAAAEEFRVVNKTWMLSPVKWFVFDCENTNEITREFYKMLIMFKTNVKRDEKRIATLHLSEKLFFQVRSDGVADAFNPLERIPAEAEEPDSGLPFESRFVNPFVNAIQKTLEVQCSTPAKPGKISVTAEVPAGIGIAAVLSLSSNGSYGSVSIFYPEKVFLKIYENMFGEKKSAIDNEMQDAAGEILNIAYGVAKKSLNVDGYAFAPSLPTVWLGEKILARQISPNPTIQIPFQIDAGQFFASIEFNKV